MTPSGPLAKDETLSRAARRLAAAGIAEPEHDAARLLARASAGDDPAAADRAFEQMISRRAEHMPLAYVEGTMSFMGRDFAVDQRVQVTRDVMEGVVEVATAVVSRLATASGQSLVSLVDVGTGCGALAIAVALNQSAAAPVYATDLSADALEVAKANVESAGLAGRVLIRHGNLLDPVPEPVDIVMANLPFVSQRMRDLVEPAVVKFEPALAVYGEGDSGWDLQRRLLEQAAARQTPPKAIIVTFHVSQEAEARAATATTFPGHEISVLELRPGWSGVLVAVTPIERVPA